MSLAQGLGALRVRSDVEHKRLHGLAPPAHSHSAVSSGLYGQDSTQATYARLAEAARAVVMSGYTAIVDAAFLLRAQRAALGDVAASTGVPIALIDLWTPQPFLRARLAARAAQGRDPSEADLAVLEHQLTTAEPIVAEEKLPVLTLDGRKALDVIGLVAVSHRLFGNQRRRSDSIRPTAGGAPTMSARAARASPAPPR